MLAFILSKDTCIVQCIISAYIIEAFMMMTYILMMLSIFLGAYHVSSYWQFYVQTDTAPSSQPAMQKSNPDSQPRRLTDISWHTSCAAPSNLGLPTKVVKGGRRLAFKSTLIKRSTDNKFCQRRFIDEVSPPDNEDAQGVKRCEHSLCLLFAWEIK